MLRYRERVVVPKADMSDVLCLVFEGKIVLEDCV